MNAKNIPVKGLRGISLLTKAFLAIIVILIPVTVTFAVGYYKSKTYLKNAAITEITEDADIFEGMIYQFLEKSAQRAQDFSTDGVIVDWLERQSQGQGPDPEFLSTYLSRHKRPIDKAIYSVSVISMKGRVLATTDRAMAGRDMSATVFFKRGLAGPFAAPVDTPTPEPVLAAVSPVYSRKTGKRIGVLANFIRISEVAALIDKILTNAHDREYQVTSFGKERVPEKAVYLVDGKMRLITRPLLFKNTALGQTVDTPYVRDCLSSRKEFSGFYENFLHTRVAGATMCIPVMDWVLVVEAEEARLLAPVSQMRKDALVGFAVVVGLVIVLFAMFFEAVVIRLRRVTAAAGTIAAGDYDVSIPVETGDEIGALSGMFNTMALEVKKRNDAIRESEGRLRAIIDNSTAVIYLKDARYRYMLVNRRYCDILGVTNESVRGKTDYDLFPAEIADAFRENDKNVLETRAPASFEETALHSDGIHYYISVKVPLLDEAGNPYALCGISTDITERRRAEEKIARLNHLYSVLSLINEAIVRIRDTQMLFDAACRIAVEEGRLIMAWVGMVDPSTLRINPAARWGAGVEYLDLTVITAKDEPQGAMPAGLAARTGKCSVVNDIEKSPEAEHWAYGMMMFGYRSAAAFPLFLGDKCVGVFCMYSGEPGFFTQDEISLLDALASDISFAITSIDTRKRAQTADEELRLIQSVSLAIRDAQDLPSAFRSVIMKLCEITGWKYGEGWMRVHDRPVLERAASWHADEEALAVFDEQSRGVTFSSGEGLPGRVWESKKPVWIIDVSIDGSEFLRSAAAMDAGIKAGLGIPVIAGDKVIAVLAFFMFETREEDARMMELTSTVAAQIAPSVQRKFAEDERFAMQKRFEELLDALTVGVYRSSIEGAGRFVEANAAFVKMLGAPSRAELLTHTVSEFYYDTARLKAVLDKVLKDGFVKNETIEVLTLSGKRIWVNMSAVMNVDMAGGIYLDGIVEDVTEMKKLEEQLIHSQKMEAVGQLAGGVAHDFNNILTAIAGYGNLMSRKAGADETLKGYADQILTLSERAANLTRGLLAFSRKQEINPQPVELNSLVGQVARILARIIGENIEMKLTLSKKDLMVMADQTSIQQAMMNLATNARDAMPAGGVLSISTGMAKLGDSYITAHGYGSIGRYAVITFSDTGTGMTKDVAQRIFEPFFTTKEVGKGTGLGLPIVYGIVKQLRGYIDVYSKPGQGATFMIYLPLMEGQVPVSKAGPVTLPRRGTETVLLAEDEPDVRAIMATVMREFGYKVIEAMDGEDAVSKFSEHRDAVTMLILDIIMPKKNGIKTYDEINAMKPGIKALFTSGYTFEKMREMGVLRDGLDFLSKPLAPMDLLKKVREVLDR